MKENGNPTWVVYAYFVSKLGDINWLQTGSCIITFGITLYIIVSSIEKYKVKGKDRSLFLFAYMAIGAIFLQAIADIRHILGFAIVTYCLFQEVEKNKSFWIHIPLYIVAALIHQSVFVLVVARLLSVVFEKRGWQSKFAIVLITIPIAFYAFSRGNQYIMSAVNKANAYLSNEEYTFIWEILIGGLEAFQTFAILKKYRMYYVANQKENFLYYFVFVLQIVSIISLPFSYAIFRRYTLFCTMIALPFWGKVLNSEISDSSDLMMFKKKMWRLSIVISILSFARGDICGYKFFEL